MENKLTIFVIIGLLLISFSLAAGVKLSNPTSSGLMFNNTTSVGNTAKFFKGDTIKLYANWSESVNGSIISTYHESGITYNSVHNISHEPSGNSVFNETFNNTWTNYTLTNSSNAYEVGVYDVYVNVTSTWENGSGTYNSTLNNFTLYGWSEINDSSLRYPTYRTSENATVEVKVVDNITNSSISYYPVNFYVNDSANTESQKLTNTSGWANFNFNESNEGVYEITYNITDNSTLYYNNSNNYEGSKIVVFDNPGIYSKNRNFSATPSSISFNWTSGNLTLKSYMDTLKLNINNRSTDIYWDYYQESLASRYTYTYNPDRCFNYGLRFSVNNETASTNYTSNLESLNSEWFELDPYYSCPPGKYSGNFTVRQVSNPPENLNVSTMINIPINPQNSLNSSSKSAEFYTKFDPNASDYHSFYFNTSSIENATGATIDMSGYNADFDIFLFDGNGNFEASSLKKGSKDEDISFVDFSPEGMWEIRIFGNNTTSSENINGNIYYTGLNSSKDSLNYGPLNVSDVGTNEFTLSNEYTDSLSDVSEYAELYQKVLYSNFSNSYEFLIPGFAEGVEFGIKWTNRSSNLNLTVRDPDGNLIGRSVNKSNNAKVVDTIMTEFVLYNQTIGSDREGYWNVSVENDSTDIDFSGISAKIYLNESKWMSSNYTDGFDFNQTGEPNSTLPVQVNITVPDEINPQNADSSYEGKLSYSGSPWSYDINFGVDVNSSGLVVNESLESMEAYFDDHNIGFDRSNMETLTFEVENTGDYNLTWENTTSDGVLKYGGNNITFDVEWPEKNITGGSSALLNVTPEINTTFTNNVDGIYRGWIFFNTTGSSHPAHPHKTFNFSLNLNLTDELNITISDILTKDGNHWIDPNSENVSYKLNAYLMNGTKLTDPGHGSGTEDLYDENFTSAWMNETNISLSNADLSSIIQRYDIDNEQSLCQAGYCWVNATVPSGLPGGYYRMHMGMEWNGSSSESELEGSGQFESLLVNNSGLYMDLVSYPSDMDNGTTDIVNVSVTNYGPIGASNAEITLDEGGKISSVENRQNSCGGSVDSSEKVVTINSISANNTQTCYIAWKITAGDSDGSTTSNVDGTSGLWFNSESFPTTINAGGTTTTTTTSDNGGGTTTTTTTVQEEHNRDISLSLDPKDLSVQQGNSSSMKVMVENTGDVLLDNLILNVSEIPDSWVDITPMEMNGLEVDEVENFSVEISPSLKSPVKEYNVGFEVSNENVSKSIDGKVKVTPSPTKRKELNASYHKYLQKYENFTEEMDKLRESGKDVSKLNETINKLEDKLSEINKSIHANNYFAVKQKLEDAESLSEESQSEIEKIKQPSGGGIPLWAIILSAVILIIVGSLFVYMFLPSEEGYQSGRGYIYKPPKEESFFSSFIGNVKEGLNRVVDKLGIEHKHDYDYTRREEWKKEEEE